MKMFTKMVHLNKKSVKWNTHFLGQS